MTIYKALIRLRVFCLLFIFLNFMVRDIGFEPMMRDSESLALPLGESREKNKSELIV